MLKGITLERTIKKYRRKLIEKLDSICTQKIYTKYAAAGNPPLPIRAGYSQEHDFWWYFGEKPAQYWNPFGLGIPPEGKNVTGRCQINMNKSGFNASLGGAFIQDEEGRIYLVHSGKVGGGQKGIGKTAFLDWYSSQPVEVDFDGRLAEYIIIADLDAQNFFQQLRFFISSVYGFKNSRATRKANHRGTLTYPSDLSGGESILRNPYTLPERVILAGANHAMIVNELRTCLIGMGYKVGRNRFIDIFIKNSRGEKTHIFEVKSTLSTQTLYTAIGQLMIYGLKLKAAHFIVLDSAVKGILVSDLEQLGIKCIMFSWEEGKPSFGELSI